MVSEKVSKQSIFLQQCLLFVVSIVLFNITYNFAAWYSGYSGRSFSFVLNFEGFIPFIPWMIIPYMSSSIFFILIFFVTTSRQELFLLAKRINFITITSFFVFIIFPLKYSFIKPEVNATILSHAFHFLKVVDTPYNQAPSLHISYAFIFWIVLKQHTEGLLRIIFSIWIIFMSLATLTIYQHHFIDIVSSLLLLTITFLFFPSSNNRNIRVGQIYLICSTLFLLFACFIWNHYLILSFFLIWISLILVLVAKAYRQSNPFFLKDTSGKIMLYKKIFFAPYILSYHMMRLFFCKNSLETVTELLPSVFIGPRLTKKQYESFSLKAQKIHVIDLTAEVEESCWVRNHAHYSFFPMLDIGVSNLVDLETIISFIRDRYKTKQDDKIIYIHCLMGYSRSTFVACLFMSQELHISYKEALQIINLKYKNCIIPDYLIQTITN